MKTKTRTALAKIRAKLGLTRLSPCRLYIVDDGAYAWIGDRAALTADDASALRSINAAGRRPDLNRCGVSAEDYAEICGRNRCVSSVCGSGVANWADLPKSWRDGSALGPISPL